MKKCLVFFVFSLLCLNLSFAEDFRRLEQEIVSLKTKIRDSKDRNVRDIEKLSSLENRLEKMRFNDRSKSKAR